MRRWCGSNWALLSTGWVHQDWYCSHGPVTNRRHQVPLRAVESLGLRVEIFETKNCYKNQTMFYWKIYLSVYFFVAIQIDVEFL